MDPGPRLPESRLGVGELPSALLALGCGPLAALALPPPLFRPTLPDLVEPRSQLPDRHGGGIPVPGEEPPPD